MAPAPLALTSGDPAGVGPEITLGAWQALKADLPFFFIGDPQSLPTGTPVAEISTPDEAAGVAHRAVPVLPLAMPSRPVPGQPASENAAAVIGAIETGVALVRSGAASALVTNPINKKVLIDGAGFAYPGHTEFLAALAGVDRVVMMLASDLLKVVPVTIHIPLSEVPAALTPSLLEDTIRITAKALERDFGLTHPRLKLAGLNPHAGEGGAMGREEIDLITPVVARLQAEGLELSGPASADTMFHPAARATYDAAICMYHDQALIPIKALDFAGGVNVTLGLPFIRTSPDHGTAFDIAGSGTADPSSLIEALKCARDMAAARAQAVA